MYTPKECLTVPVFHYPVLHSIISLTISHQQHAMIETVTVTASLSIYAITVELEVIVSGIHTYTDGASSIDSIKKGNFTACLNVSVADATGSDLTVLRHTVPFL